MNKVRPILEGIYAFPPNRETLGSTAYFIVRNGGNILLDCPLLDEENQQFLQDRGGFGWLFLTHRGSISRAVGQLRHHFGCEILIQEQEAYLLPKLKLSTFKQELAIKDDCQVIWTPGYSPGSACLYSNTQGGILFTGRHLLPNQQGEPVPLRTAKTFHWYRQLHSIQILRERFSRDTLQYICPGANTGFLQLGAINQAYERLLTLELETLRQTTAPI